MWSVDSNGNYVSSLLTTVSGASNTLESLETTFQQDLNGDGTIGPSNTVVESAGSTSLIRAGVDYYLESNSTDTGALLQYAGAAVTVGIFGVAWSLVGAEQVSGDYDVAWKNSSTVSAMINSYQLWTSSPCSATVSRGITPCG